MKDVLKQVSGLLDVLEDYNRGPRVKAVKKVQSDMEKASSEAEKKMVKAAESDDAGVRTSATYYRALLNFNIANLKWFESPATGMARATMMSLRSSLVLVQKSMSAYK